MSPLTEQALMTLTMRINLATGLDHYSDDSAAKEILKLLRDEGEYLDGAEITRWAVGRHWKPEHAKRLGELAEHIGCGGRVVVRDKGRWPKDIIERLKERIAPSRLKQRAKKVWENTVADDAGRKGA